MRKQLKEVSVKLSIERIRLKEPEFYPKTNTEEPSARKMLTQSVSAGCHCDVCKCLTKWHTDKMAEMPRNQLEE